ncbi:hypothetical protein QQX98_008208 [Neonectria punicea]|uniref:Homeobox domain-containing protein n=1 Tax=Neonectria punicea TaxID=979145 RepID=A0ABR1GWX9_9HYPO
MSADDAPFPCDFGFDSAIAVEDFDLAYPNLDDEFDIGQLVEQSNLSVEYGDSAVTASWRECPSPASPQGDCNIQTLDEDSLTFSPASRATPPPPKIGARFSRQAVGLLRNWLSAHSAHPFPNDEEKEILQRQTGLSKTQIQNWLVNARRRGKVPPRPSLSHDTPNGPINIPQRRPTPSVEDGNRLLNPLQRWVDSPPENEPANAAAIARAVASNSTPSSETFTTKHIWQRHEKTLHLPLERWFGRPLDLWKLPRPEVRSVCGFCGLEMDTWAFRVDHLADHFKTGSTMADWKGDWGFDASVLVQVENAIPPCQ